MVEAWLCLTVSGEDVTFWVLPLTCSDLIPIPVALQQGHEAGSAGWACSACHFPASSRVARTAQSYCSCTLLGSHGQCWEWSQPAQAGPTSITVDHWAKAMWSQAAWVRLQQGEPLSCVLCNSPGRAAMAFGFDTDTPDGASNSALNVVKEISMLTAACQISSRNASLSERQGNSVTLSSDVIECLQRW